MVHDIQFGSGADSLILRILGRTQSDTQSYWEANWLRCTAEASAGAFRGTLEWQLRNEDLARFVHALEGLNERVGEALLETLDGWLDVRVIRDDRGRIRAQCQLTDNPDGGNSLDFSLSLDQTALSTLAVQIREVLERFPVVGREKT